MSRIANNDSQLDISGDNYLSLMDDAGNTKDDVKLEAGEIKEKITKLFIEQGKDTSESGSCSSAKCHINTMVDVVILTAMNMQVATEAKEAPRVE